MATVPTQVRIDENLKNQSVELGIVTVPHYKPEVLQAMEEAKALSMNPNAKRYSNFKEAANCQ